MNSHPLRFDRLPEDAPAPAAGPRRLPQVSAVLLRRVHRATAELRRGTPVLLQAEPGLVMLAAETAEARGLEEFRSLAEGSSQLLLAPSRAAAVLHRPIPPNAAAVALRLPPPLLEPAALQALADPTLPQEFAAEPIPVPAPLPVAIAALSLAKLAQLLPAALVAPPRVDAAERLAELGLLAVPAADVAAYPSAVGASIKRLTEVEVPLEGAPDARIVAFRAVDAGLEHLAILVGRPETHRAPLVRLHSECFTGDLLGSLRCDCGAQLRGAIRRMAEEGAGAVLYLAQEGRGIGLLNKLRAYALQDGGLDTLDANRALGWGADERNFLVAAIMLRSLGLHEVRLLTNNLEKVDALAACGLTVHREPLVIAPNGVNDRYLATKAQRFGHLLD